MDTWLYVVSQWVNVASICVRAVQLSLNQSYVITSPSAEAGSYVDEIKRDICLTQVCLYPIVVLPIFLLRDWKVHFEGQGEGIRKSLCPGLTSVVRNPESTCNVLLTLRFTNADD